MFRRALKHTACNVPDAINQVVDEIRVSDAVILVGAGASYAAGMPLAGQLSPLVWHALDHHQRIRERVAHLLGSGDAAAKVLLGDDVRAVTLAFREIAGDDACRATFQNAFASLDRDRQNHASEAHDGLARLVYSGLALRVVSLNWDTLLEAAFERRCGADINGQHQVLWKPHGDARDPGARWILPHEDGCISDEIVTDLESLARERPRVLLIVGYSERDDIVVRRLVDPLAARWRVFRLSPGATGEGAIQLAAHVGLVEIADALCSTTEVPGWEFVAFSEQRGLEAAVSGERLGPRDVDSCPRLPQFATAHRTLDILNKVDIAGPPGCGKSITAWQLARDLNQAGWHVLRPVRQKPDDGTQLLSSLRKDLWKRVVVVDDAQTFGELFTERLNELAGPRLAVITGTTDATGEQPRSIRIPTQVAVETLADDFRRRRSQVLPIVKKYDSRIGDEYMATPLEWRLDEAAKASTPWEFAFILRGGWMRAREQFSVLRDFDRADLLLVLIAARQLVSLDAGSDLGTIVGDAHVLGRSEGWVASNIELLRRQQAVLPGLPLRCLHIQSAIIVIESALKRRDADGFQAVVGALRRMVYDPNTAIRGIYWLNERVLGADAFRYSVSDPSHRFYERDRLEALLNRLLASKTAVERRDAAFVLSRLLWYQELDKERLRSEFGTLREWLESATGENGYALGELLNYVGSKAPYDELVRLMDPAAVWRCLEAFEPATGYSWGHLLGRLAYAGGDGWRRQALSVADPDRLLRFVRQFTPRELGGLTEFILGLSGFDRGLGLEAVRQAFPTLKAAYELDALAAYQGTSDLEHRVLGHPLFSPPRPSKAQLDVSRELTSAIRPEDVTSGIATRRFGDWETYARLLNFIQRVNRKKHAAIAATVPWEALEKRCETFWSRPPREMRLLLSSLVARRNGEPVRSWILRHSHLIDEIDPILSGLSPESAIAVTSRGGRVNLAGHNGSDWRLQSWALASVAKLDPSVARTILQMNQGHVVDRLSKMDGVDAEEFVEFLKVVKELDRAWFLTVLRQVDVQSAPEKWQRVLSDERAEVRKGATRTLRFIVEEGEGAARDLAETALNAVRPQPPRGGSSKPRRRQR
jgi:hypothetical protein